MKHEQLEIEPEPRNMCSVCHGELDEQGDCPVCSDPETYRTWDDIVADEIEHQATKRLARPVNMMTQSPTSLQTFLTCPKQYHAKYITKEVKFEQNDHATFGDLVHKSIENYLKHQEPLPTILHPLQPTLDKMGQVLFGAETKLAVDKQGNAVDFFAKTAYQRCIVDAILTNADKSIVVCIDWKTGKKRDAQMQHDFIKKCAKAKFPNAKIVTLFLYFFVGQYDRQEYTGQELIALDRNMANLASAHANDLFQPRPGGLCKKWCDVLSCPYNGKNK